MSHLARWSRGIPILLTLAFALVTLAPAAGADPGHGRGNAWGRRYKGVDSWSNNCGYGYGGPRRVIVRERSSAGPAIAGFIGGLVVGSVLNNAHGGYCDRPVYRERVVYRDTYAPSYCYYDAYCHESFPSLDLYYRHAYHRHPLVAREIDVRSGECVDTFCYHDGRWCGGYGPDYAYHGDNGYDGDRYGDRDDDGDN
jgi:hypothetical protein